MRHQGAKSFADLDAMLEGTANDWANCLGSLSEAQATFRPEGEWCAKEVVGHVLLTDRSINRGIARMAGVEPPTGPVPEARSMGLRSEEEETLPIEELAGRVAVLFDECRVLTSTLARGGSLEKTFPHPLFGQLNLKEWIAFHRLHAMDHIQQIDKIKADPAYPRP
jgi:hypothetical protein